MYANFMFSFPKGAGFGSDVGACTEAFLIATLIFQMNKNF